jgi:hypothetical protein
MSAPWWFTVLVGGLIVAAFVVLEITQQRVDQYLGVAALAVVTTIFARGYVKRNGGKL